MKKLNNALFLTFLALLVICVIPAKSFGQVILGPPPPTPIDIVVDTLHGTPIEDPYRWLEDQESAETREWIDTQNEYTQSILGSLPGREKLQERFSQLLRTDRITIPTQRSGRYFLYKRAADQDMYIIYMREGLDGEDEILVDPHTLSPDLTKSVGISDVSQDGKVLAYSIREGGEDEAIIKLMNVDTKEELPDQLPKGVYFGFSLAHDMSGYYYSLRKEEGSRVYYHELGSDPAEDVEIFGEGYGPEKIVGAGISEDGRYLVIMVFYGSSGEKSEIYYQDLLTRDEIKPLVNDIDATFYGTFVNDLFLMRTNWEAPNSRILAVDMKQPSRDNWRELIPETDAVINGFSVAGGKLFVNYLENVVSRVKIFELDGKNVGEIAFPALGTVSNVVGRWQSNDAFFVYTSFHIPTTIFRYDVANGTRDIWDRLDVPVDTDNFEVKQVWYNSKDGTKVPMFLVYKKGIKLDGSNPTLLTAYGGFRASMTPYFSSTAVTWVEHGGVYAVPNIRGGGEFGEEWHKAAIFEKKQNSFDDFYAAAEWLIENGYTQPSKLSIRGGSNGGLLVGAAFTQRPELFKAVVCSYPLLDMLRYHKFLMGPYWVTEYGSADEPDQFEYIYAYSPYHNVKPKIKYPAVLFVTGDSDTRVDPMHARKMAALLQSAAGSDTPILLDYEIKAGHSGGRALSKTIEDITDQQIFLFWQLGIE